MKIRNGFVSNSSSSSFVIGDFSEPVIKTRVGNPLEAWDWLQVISNFRNKEGMHLWMNGERIDFRYQEDDEDTNLDRVAQYMGCCEMCYDEFQSWDKSEFIKEFAEDRFQFSQEQADKFNSV